MEVRRAVLGDEHVDVTGGPRVGVGVAVGHQAPRHALQQHMGHAQIVENRYEVVTLRVDEQVASRQATRPRGEPLGEGGRDHIEQVELSQAPVEPEHAALVLCVRRPPSGVQVCPAPTQARDVTVTPKTQRREQQVGNLACGG